MLFTVTQKTIFSLSQRTSFNRIISLSFVAFAFRCERIAFGFTLDFSLWYYACLCFLCLRLHCRHNQSKKCLHM